ncbi:hypothetical protein D9M71_415640 [compost metagenome]
MAAGLAVGDEAAGDFGQRLVAGALGLDVDAAADAAIGRDAAEQSARPLEDIHPLDHFHVDGIGRQHAIETAEGHITVIEAETTHGELLETAAGGVGVTHGRVVRHHVGQGPRLLVLDQLTGVGGDVEGRFHEIPVTQQAKAAAARHLAAVIGVAAQAHAAADDGDLRQLGQVAALLGLQLQGIGARSGRAQPQSTALQQARETFFHLVLALKPGAAAPGHQRRVQRQADARLAGETGQGAGQAARGHLVTAPVALLAPGDVGETGAGAQEQQQARAHQRAPQRNGYGKQTGSGGHRTLTFRVHLSLMTSEPKKRDSIQAVFVRGTRLTQ